MLLRRYDFGPTTVAKVGDAPGLRDLLADAWLESPTIIIKPNWVSTEPADFSDARVMRLLFEALDGRIVVTESHMLLRSANRDAGKRRFTIGDKDVTWNWLLKGEGWGWLQEQPDWSWFKEGGHWERIREEEQAFLDEFGFSELFDEFDVEYINVTEEVWNGRVAAANDIRACVEARFTPLRHQALYGMVPSRLFDLRGATFISLAKLKCYASFAFKNLFGMIPDPLRPCWHGRDGRHATDSIVDINKIYHALFNVYGICEALYERAVPATEGEFQGVYSGRYNVVDGPGVVACGRDVIALDKLLLYLTEGDIVAIPELNRTPLEVAEGEFGEVDKRPFAQARETVGHWFALGSSESATLSG